jgi:hypothetical protein
VGFVGTQPTLRIYNMHNVVGTVTVPLRLYFTLILRQALVLAKARAQDRL